VGGKKFVDGRNRRYRRINVALRRPPPKLAACIVRQFTVQKLISASMKGDIFLIYYPV